MASALSALLSLGCRTFPRPARLSNAGCCPVELVYSDGSTATATDHETFTHHRVIVGLPSSNASRHCLAGSRHGRRNPYSVTGYINNMMGDTLSVRNFPTPADSYKKREISSASSALRSSPISTGAD